MNINVTAQPTPDATRAGDLYVDQQSRQLWLGVDQAVDPTGSVLISDIEYLENAIDASLVEAKAYTDTQIITRAPTIHTHTSSQITDFDAAVTAVASAIPGLQYVKGMIMIFSGLLTEIGVGPLAGWALCDGSNGTPNLRDKFVIGAGNKLPGAANTLASLTTPDAGSHIHVNTGTALTVAQLPSHNHGGITGYISHDHAHSFNVNSGTESHDHQHYIGLGSWTVKGESWSLRPVGSDSSGISSGRTQAHYHNVAGSTGGVHTNHYHAIPAEGSGGTHTHTVQAGGIHNHVIAQSTLREAIPFLAYAFIMKL